MADDALTRKEAEMGRLTRDQVELLRAGLLASEWCGYSKRGTVNALCDLALRAISLESVREEALANAEKSLLTRQSWLDEGRREALEEAANVPELLGGGGIRHRARAAIRALQHG